MSELAATKSSENQVTDLLIGRCQAKQTDMVDESTWNERNSLERKC